MQNNADIKAIFNYLEKEYERIISEIRKIFNNLKEKE